MELFAKLENYVETVCILASMISYHRKDMKQLMSSVMTTILYAIKSGRNALSVMVLDSCFWRTSSAYQHSLEQDAAIACTMGMACYDSVDEKLRLLQHPPTTFKELLDI